MDGALFMGSTLRSRCPKFTTWSQYIADLATAIATTPGSERPLLHSMQRSNQMPGNILILFSQPISNIQLLRSDKSASARPSNAVVTGIGSPTPYLRCLVTQDQDGQVADGLPETLSDLIDPTNKTIDPTKQLYFAKERELFQPSSFPIGGRDLR
jgi:hypothetical protein